MSFATLPTPSSSANPSTDFSSSTPEFLLVFASNESALHEALERAEEEGFTTSPTNEVGRFVLSGAPTATYLAWLRDYSACEWLLVRAGTNDEAPRVLDDSRAILRQ